MADVLTFPNWSTTASSNKPAGTDVVGSGLADNLREIQAQVRTGLAYYNSTPVASGSTVDLGAQSGNFLLISGTTTITSFGTTGAGVWKVITFQGALTLTHNATSLILPGGASITTAAGDTAIVVSLGSGNWRCVSYERANGLPVSSSAVTLTGSQVLTNKTLTSPVIDTGVSGTAVATQTQMEAASSTSLLVTPGRQHHHPGMLKAWVKFQGADGVILADYGVNSVTRNSTGNYTVTFDTAFSSGNYFVSCPITTDTGSTTSGGGSFKIVSQSTTTCNFTVGRVDSGALVDPTHVWISFAGDL